MSLWNPSSAICKPRLLVHYPFDWIMEQTFRCKSTIASIKMQRKTKQVKTRTSHLIVLQRDPSPLSEVYQLIISSMISLAQRPPDLYQVPLPLECPEHLSMQSQYHLLLLMRQKDSDWTWTLETWILPSGPSSYEPSTASKPERKSPAQQSNLKNKYVLQRVVNLWKVSPPRKRKEKQIDKLILFLFGKMMRISCTNI